MQSDPYSNPTDPKEQLFTFLLQYRATPHSSTEKSPAEMLFGRRIRTKLPQIVVHQDTEQQKRTRDIHDNKKMEQKRQFDRKHKARPKHINVGDKVLIKQQKTTIKPPYNPDPFTVTKVKGNRVTMTNGEKTRVRDKNKVKLVKQLPAIHNKASQPKKSSTTEEELDISLRKVSPSTQQQERAHEASEMVHEPSNPDENRMNYHLQTLLQAAENRAATAISNNTPIEVPQEQRITRSSGKTLSWNPVMNSVDAVVEEQQGGT